MISRDIINSGTFQNNLFCFRTFFFGDQAVNLGVYSPEIIFTKVSVPFYQLHSKGFQAEVGGSENQIRCMDEPTQQESLHFGLYSLCSLRHYLLTHTRCLAFTHAWWRQNIAIKEAAITAAVLRFWRTGFSYLNQPKMTLAGQCVQAHHNV